MFSKIIKMIIESQGGDKQRVENEISFISDGIRKSKAVKRKERNIRNLSLMTQITNMVLWD